MSRRSMLKPTLVYFLAALSAPLLPRRAFAAADATLDSAGIEFFEKKIRPLLTSQCYKCHSTSASKLKGNLYLDSRDGLLKGGDGGPAVLPGHPEQSLLIEAINYTNDDLKMPPKTRLPAAAVADLKQWVKSGAVWPGASSGATPAPARPASPRVPPANYEKLRKEHWAWQPVTTPSVPAVRDANWPRTDADHFVLARLEEAGIHPVADADRTTLIRRVSFDLTGLPPTPEQTAAFVNDPSPKAFEKVVDRLLASPAFGERWGRHWLDVVRYAESTGSSRNYPYPFAWRYRDYVIDSFNNDKRYDRFITEQVAGDLLPYETPKEHNEQLIATGFLAMGVKDLNERDKTKFLMDNVDEQIDTTTRAVLALTVGCARCHDHKFDPIPQSDYYALAGIFRSTDILAGLHNRQGGGKKAAVDPTMLVHLDGPSGVVPASAVATAGPSRNAASMAADARRLAQLREELRKAVAQAQTLRDEAGPAKRAQLREKVKDVRRIQAAIDELEGGPPLTPTEAAVAAMGVRDDARPADARICIRGEPDDLGASVARGFAGVVNIPETPKIDPAHSGRLELSRWLTHPDNPLTARVMANRIWEHLFGEGLVRTVDNFGSTGEHPSDQALLDHLALQFEHQGWSVKSMVRMLVLTHAYQLSSTVDSAAMTLDPGNRLTWRMSPRRLDAEEIRDAVLSASGTLDGARPIASPVIGLGAQELRTGAAANLWAGDRHRSVYLPIIRDLVPPVLELFDFAEPTLVTGQRDVTTVATQALFLMNDLFMVEQSKQLATRVQGARSNDPARIDLMYQLSLARAPSSAERARALRYLNEPTADQKRPDHWASFAQALLASAEFRYLN